MVTPDIGQGVPGGSQGRADPIPPARPRICPRRARFSRDGPDPSRIGPDPSRVGLNLPIRGVQRRREGGKNWGPE